MQMTKGVCGVRIGGVAFMILVIEVVKVVEVWDWKGVIYPGLGYGRQELFIYSCVLSSVEHELVEASDEFIVMGRAPVGFGKGVICGGASMVVELGRLEVSRTWRFFFEVQPGHNLSRQCLKLYTERDTKGARLW